jgi:hypothetical protein
MHRQKEHFPVRCIRNARTLEMNPILNATTAAHEVEEIKLVDSSFAMPYRSGGFFRSGIISILFSYVCQVTYFSVVKA